MPKNREIATDHPHIRKIVGSSGLEQAVIAGTGLRVWSIIDQYQMGLAVEEILNHWDFLTPAQLFDAVAYYHDHKTEIEQTMRQNQDECAGFFANSSVDEPKAIS